MLPLAVNVIDPLAIALMLFLAGCALLAAEVFVPSGGVLGFLAAVSLLAAIWFAFQRGATYAATFTLVEVIGAPLVVYYAFKWLPRTTMGKRLMGEAPTPEEVELDDARHELVGRVGVARSKMLPSGAVEVEGQVLDAVTQGRPVDPGQYVKIVEVRGNRVVVRPAGDGERPQTANPSDLLARPADELGIDGLDLSGLDGRSSGDGGRAG